MMWSILTWVMNLDPLACNFWGCQRTASPSTLPMVDKSSVPAVKVFVCYALRPLQHFEIPARDRSG
eukprot:2725123-Amphidinium_carterae.1